MATDTEDEIVLSEAAEILGVERSTFFRWMQLGKIAPSRKLPGRTGSYLFRRSDVESLKAQAGAA